MELNPYLTVKLPGPQRRRPTTLSCGQTSNLLWQCSGTISTIDTVMFIQRKILSFCFLVSLKLV